MKAISIIFFLGMTCFVQVANSKPISIVTFNAENLFDIEDDINNPRDDTYLPKAIKDARGQAHTENCETHNKPGFYRDQCKTLDWDSSTYNAKLKAYADVVLSMPQIPDVLVIPETENRKVVEDLTKRFLSELNYNIIQLDTSDEPISRGIDVAILSRLPVKGKPVAHTIDFKGDQELCGVTRDIVQAELELPNKDSLHVFGVHFPSGRSPTRCRYRAFNFLNELTEKLPPESLFISAGDFNVNCNESVSDAYQRLLFQGNWFTSPIITHGCTAPGSSKHTDRLLGFWHTWSFLDQILVSKELSPSQFSTKNWFADLGSFQTIVVSPSQYKVDRRNKGFIEPKRFNPSDQSGVSDHWPVGIRLLMRRSEP